MNVEKDGLVEIGRQGSGAVRGRHEAARLLGLADSAFTERPDLSRRREDAEVDGAKGSHLSTVAACDDDHGIR